MALPPASTTSSCPSHESEPLAQLVSQDQTNRLVADPFAEETFALAALGTLWSIESEPEGKLQAGPPLVFV